MTQQPPKFEDVNNCRKCNTGFSLFTRKHHCRACGRTFCSNCSAGSIPLPQFGISEAVRVCEQCENAARRGGQQSQSAPSASASASAPPAVRAPAPTTQHHDDSSSSSSSSSSFTHAPAKKVSKCTCGSPLCICPPDADEKSAAEVKSTAPAPTPVKKPVTSSSSSSSSTTSSFQGFGSTKSSTVWNMSGDLNEQLREAVKSQDVSGIKQLIGGGADAKYIDRTGNSLLHLAAMFNRYDIIELLVSHGGDVWVRNPAKETPVDLAPPALQRKMRELQPPPAGQ